jgi:hypothetical protein
VRRLRRTAKRTCDLIIRAIAVAGVALGSAALARNIADALNTDVAGIVTGYGLSDVMTEAFGGWFAFGAADRIKYTMEKFFERMRSTMPADAAPAAGDASATLSEILLAGPPKLEYLVAHSMGSLVVSHAPALCRGSGRRRERFVRALAHHHTRGRGRLPPTFKKVQQYLGALDWFGRANSSLGVMHERVPEAGHHLNPGIPYHMSVAALLNGGAAHRMLPKPPAADVFAPLPIPPLAAAREPMAAVKAKEAVRSPVKKAAKPPSPAPKVRPAPKVTSAAPKVASPAPKVSAAPRAASPAPKAASPAPKRRSRR